MKCGGAYGAVATPATESFLQLTLRSRLYPQSFQVRSRCIKYTRIGYFRRKVLRVLAVQGAAKDRAAPVHLGKCRCQLTYIGVGSSQKHVAPSGKRMLFAVAFYQQVERPSISQYTHRQVPIELRQPALHRSNGRKIIVTEIVRQLRLFDGSLQVSPALLGLLPSKGNSRKIA